MKHDNIRCARERATSRFGEMLVIRIALLVGRASLGRGTRPDDPDTLYYLGRALLKKHQPADAARSLQHALQVNPEDSHARNALAVALAAIKDYAGAKTQLQRARALEPGNALYERNLSCMDRDLRDCDLDF